MTVYERYLALYCLVVWILGIVSIELLDSAIPAVVAAVIIGVFFSRRVPADA